MQALLPDIECRAWDNPGDKSEIEYAVVWKPPAGGLKTFPNLKCIVSGSAAAALRLKSIESGAGRFTDFLFNH